MKPTLNVISQKGVRRTSIRESSPHESESVGLAPIRSKERKNERAASLFSLSLAAPAFIIINQKEEKTVRFLFPFGSGGAIVYSRNASFEVNFASGCVAHGENDAQPIE